METTKELCQRAKLVGGIRSDYELAKRLGITRQAVSKYVNGVAGLDDERAELIADILGVDPGYVMACCHAERSKSPKTKSNWARVAALVLAAAATPAAHSMDLSTSGTGSHNSAKGIDIMSSRRRRLSVALAGIFGPGSLQIAI